MPMLKGRIHSFESFGAVDGPGVRFVIFFQGCPLRCRFCHNPDTWAFEGGTEYTSDELVEKVLPYRLFYRGGGGVTLSGGEPTAQHEFVTELLNKLRAENIHTAIDTSGGIPLSVCRDAVDAADMLLLDIKSIDPDMSRNITGNPDTLKNEKEILKYCESQQKPVWIRHVVVPGLTLEETQLRALGDYLRGFECVKRIEPLPFHKLGEHKWLPGLYTLTDTEPPTSEQMAEASRLLGAKK
jgi:pyruvate formate lyase activating enzyme